MSLTERDIRVLHSSVLLAALSIETVNQLTNGRAPIELRKGQLLFQHGDPADAFFIVVDGWVKLYRQKPDGEEVVVYVAGAGESFAEAAMFLGGEYPVSAEAATDARVESIDASTMRAAIARDPSVGFAMLGATSRHLRHLVDQIEQLKKSNGTQRVAEFLIEQCPDHDGKAVLRLPFEKVLIAARLGMTPESFSRALAKLRPYGVESKGSTVEVLDCRALRAEFACASDHSDS